MFWTILIPGVEDPHSEQPTTNLEKTGSTKSIPNNKNGGIAAIPNHKLVCTIL